MKTKREYGKLRMTMPLTAALRTLKFGMYVKSANIRRYAVAGLTGIGLLGLVAGCSHPEFTNQPITLAQFTNQFASINLPLSATNIFFARSSVGLGGRALLYQFDAPVSDCLGYAQQLIEASNRQADRPEWRVATNLVTLTTPPTLIENARLQPYGLSKIRWFDLASVRSGFSGRAGPSGQGSFWVDTEHGRFYYFWTD